MPDATTSLSLLLRVRSQNAEAWDRLVFLYAPLVRHWCQRWGVNGTDIEDIQQEVFQAVARNLPSFHRDRPGDTFRGWLRVIVRSKFLDHCRRLDRQPVGQGGSTAQIQFALVPDQAPDTDDDAPEEVKSLHHRALELVKSEFEERTWQAFWRCAVEDQSPAEVGQAMDMTPAAVRKAKSRVLRRLKEEMGDLLG
jgi:RNA polymerase sigma-70 factor (ECF subfamily)